LPSLFFFPLSPFPYSLHFHFLLSISLSPFFLPFRSRLLVIICIFLLSSLIRTNDYIFSFANLPMQSRTRLRSFYLDGKRP
jgi:hypothetical protein